MRLLPIDLGQQQFLPVVGAVDIAGTQLGGQAVTLAVEQQQRMIASGLEVAVASTLLLPAMDPDFGAVHVHYYRRGETIAALMINSRLSATSPARFSCCVSTSVSNDCKREVNAAPRSQILREPMSRKVGS